MNDALAAVRRDAINGAAVIVCCKSSLGYRLGARSFGKILLAAFWWWIWFSRKPDCRSPVRSSQCVTIQFSE